MLQLISAPIHLQVPVSTWGRLDASASWQELAEGAAQAQVLQAVEQFKPDVVLGVDWTSLKVCCPGLQRPRLHVMDML